MTTHDVIRDGTGTGLLADSIGWDVANWGRALEFCASRSQLEPGGRALEVGADGANGGLSLFLAGQGWHVTCSGLGDPPPVMRELHARHGVTDRVQYARLDVLDLPAAPVYDLVVLKSVLGHVGQDGRYDLQQQAVANLHRVLRPGGELWILENGTATRLHQLVRDRVGAGRCGWRYLRPQELEALLAPFAQRQLATFGVAGAGGRSERQRAGLGRLDRAVLEPLLPASWRYVLAAVARRASA